MNSLWVLLAADASVHPVGRIQGGWEYVWGAYAVTWVGLLAYALSLWLRWPKAEQTKEKS